MEERKCFNSFIEISEQYNIEEELLNSSFKYILQIIQNFPIEEFDIFSKINNNKNQLSVNKYGEFYIFELGFFRKIFKLKHPLPIRYMENILSNAFTNALSILQVFNKDLILAFPAPQRKELRCYLDIIANRIYRSYIGISILQKENNTDSFIANKLKRFKIDLKTMMYIFEKCRLLIPVHNKVQRILKRVDDMNDTILSGSPKDLAETCIQSDAIIKLTEIAGINGIAIRDVCKNIKIESLATLREYLDYAENILDIETSEDYLFALKLCKDTIAAVSTLKEDGVDILKRAKKLETYILEKLEYIKKQEENLELLIESENTTSRLSF